MASKGDEITLTVSTGEMPELSREVTISLPQNIEGDFQFKYYVDGVLDEEATETRDVSFAASKTLKYTVKGKSGEERELTIKVKSAATGNEGTYLSVKVAFEDDKTSIVPGSEQRNSNIFEELSSVPEPEPSEPEPSQPESSQESSSEPETPQPETPQPEQPQNENPVPEQ